MMLLALTWADATVWIAVAAAAALIGVSIFGSTSSRTAIGPQKLEAIEDDLVLIRADLADIKQSLAELDRLFKSVG